LAASCSTASPRCFRPAVLEHGYLSGASGSKMYWEIGVQLYNIAFTGLPIVVVGVMDKDLPASAFHQ